MCNAFFVDIPTADFKLADKFLADALLYEGDMRMRLIGDCHGFAVAELEPQQKMAILPNSANRHSPEYCSLKDSAKETLKNSAPPILDHGKSMA